MTPDQRSLRDALAAVPARLASGVRAMPAAGPDARDPLRPTVPGAWSDREVVLHLAAVEEEVWHARLDALATATFPRWPWVEPGLWAGPGADTFSGALAAFASRRAATIARLDSLDAAGWARRGLHATFGELDVAALLRIALDHDEEHLAQIESD